MQRSVGLVLLVAGASLLVDSPAFAADAGEGSPQPTIADLLERIETLEEDKTTMRGEIDELHAQLGDTWLTEQRADEVRNLVADVLSDADVRASLLQAGLIAGWSDHFFLASPDGRFKLQLEGQLQFRYVWNYHDLPDRYIGGFENTRTKLAFRGHVFNRDLTYLVKGRFDRDGGGFGLEDAWVRYLLNNEWSVRAGQFKLPFGREELVSSARQLAVERSLINESLNLGRSQGVELTYANHTSRLSFAVSDAGQEQVGGFSIVGTTSPSNTPALEPGLAEYAVTGRYEKLIAGRWAQFDDFTSPAGEQFGLLVGVGAHLQQDEFGTGFGSARDEELWLAWTVDASVEWGGASVFASMTHHIIDDPALGDVNVYGLVIQGGAYLTPKFEAFARFEYGVFDFEALDFDDVSLLTLGGNYYFDGHDAKLSADIGFGLSQIESAWDSDIAGWRRDLAGSEPQVVIRTQLQLLF
ncbi:MAG: hypothetical protein IH830_00700 [Planctomycetes bacterium]|nr:hypothetical protein [Planctomycetota bacterium]